MAQRASAATTVASRRVALGLVSDSSFRASTAMRTVLLRERESQCGSRKHGEKLRSFEIAIVRPRGKKQKGRDRRRRPKEKNVQFRPLSRPLFRPLSRPLFRPLSRAHDTIQRPPQSLNFKTTKKKQVVCTLGPKSRSVEVLEELLRAGMSVARFNFSHGSHEYHQV